MSNFIIYTLIIVLSAILFYKKDDTLKNKACLLIPMIIMCFMSSFRGYDIGNDTQAYMQYFQHIFNGNTNYNERIELGYKLWNIIISKFSNNYTFFLTATSALIFFFVTKFAKDYSSDFILFVIFFWLLAFVSFVSPLRQSMALAFLIAATRMLFCNKPAKFILFVIVASLFHTSALIYGILIITAKLKVTPKILFLVLIGICALGFTDIFNVVLSIFPNDEYYSRYLDVQAGLLSASFNAAFGLLPVLIDSYIGKNSCTVQNNDKQKENILKWCSIFYFGFYLLSIKSSGSGRIAYYFLPQTIVLWSNVCNKLRKSAKLAIVLSIICILLTYKCLALVYRPEWNSFFPFHYVWDK